MCNMTSVSLEKTLEYLKIQESLLMERNIFIYFLSTLKDTLRSRINGGWGSIKKGGLEICLKYNKLGDWNMRGELGKWLIGYLSA